MNKIQARNTLMDAISKETGIPLDEFIDTNSEFYCDNDVCDNLYGYYIKVWHPEDPEDPYNEENPKTILVHLIYIEQNRILKDIKTKETRTYTIPIRTLTPQKAREFVRYVRKDIVS